MKKLILLLLIFTSYKSTSQDFKEIKYSELSITISKDSAMVFSANNKLLNGKYKVLYDGSTHYALNEFVDGRGEGKSEYYMDGKLKATSELKNGLQNGLSIIYDETGKVKWKIEMVNGKRHGLAWFKDIGEKYYIMDKESTKEEFEAYQRH